MINLLPFNFCLGQNVLLFSSFQFVSKCLTRAFRLTGKSQNQVKIDKKVIILMLQLLYVLVMLLHFIVAAPEKVNILN